MTPGQYTRAYMCSVRLTYEKGCTYRNNSSFTKDKRIKKPRENLRSSKRIIKTQSYCYLLSSSPDKCRRNHVKAPKMDTGTSR